LRINLYLIVIHQVRDSSQPHSPPLMSPSSLTNTYTRQDIIHSLSMTQASGGKSSPYNTLSRHPPPPPRNLRLHESAVSQSYVSGTGRQFITRDGRPLLNLSLPPQQWQLPTDMPRPIRCARAGNQRGRRGTEMTLEQPRIVGIQQLVQRAPPYDIWQPAMYLREMSTVDVPDPRPPELKLTFREKYVAVSPRRLRSPGTKHGDVGNNRGGGGATPTFDTPLIVYTEHLESIGSGSSFSPRRDVIKGRRYVKEPVHPRSLSPGILKSTFDRDFM
jgi:hypothetical protein